MKALMLEMLTEVREKQGHQPNPVKDERIPDKQHPLLARETREELNFQRTNSIQSYTQSEASVSGREEQKETALSDEEENVAEAPAFTGLFRQHLFKMLLGKAKAAADLGTTTATDSSDPKYRLFARTKMECEIVPSPELFKEVMEGQLDQPVTFPTPGGNEKIYNFEERVASRL
ncbi:hypothetical protein E2320_022178 [Naja naja]|nr:hypothetical protein E2320_022178 [Naja naja]